MRGSNCEIRRLHYSENDETGFECNDAAKPEVLILDDSSSALDFLTDLNMRRAISSLDPKPTTFIVSQRAAAVKHADVIVVLDEGKEVGLGKRDELYENCPVYREIESSQEKGAE